MYLISELTNQHVDMSEPETGKKQVLKVVSLKSGRFKAEILPPPKKTGISNSYVERIFFFHPFLFQRCQTCDYLWGFFWNVTFHGTVMFMISSPVGVLASLYRGLWYCQPKQCTMFRGNHAKVTIDLHGNRSSQIQKLHDFLLYQLPMYFGEHNFRRLIASNVLVHADPAQPPHPRSTVDSC